MIIERGQDDWLVSEVVELPGCHTQAKTFDELIRRTKEAINAYKANENSADDLPKFVGVHQMEV